MSNFGSMLESSGLTKSETQRSLLSCPRYLCWIARDEWTLGGQGRQTSGGRAFKSGQPSLEQRVQDELSTGHVVVVVVVGAGAGCVVDANYLRMTMMCALT